MPRIAQIMPIPRRYEAAGVRRYGFHGLSYAYLMEELARVAGPDEARGRVILAHLGAGASLAAVRGGQCIETTMGFTPASGLVMGDAHWRSRSGAGPVPIADRGDDGRPVPRTRQPRVGPARRLGDQFRFARPPGTTGCRCPGGRGDRIVLLPSEEVDWRLAAALGGLDTLVFAGGIGENSPETRRRICAGMEFLGIDLDEGRNASGAPLISTDQGPVKVRVIPTDEESDDRPRPPSSWLVRRRHEFRSSMLFHNT